MKTRLVLSFETLILTSVVFAQSAWNGGVPISAGGRNNINNYSIQDFTTYRNAGKIHAQFYPKEARLNLEEKIELFHR